MPFIIRNPRTLLLVLFAPLSLGFLCSSCAFGDRHINLTYGSAPAAPVGAVPATRVAMTQLQDGRPAKENGEKVLGKIRNGYGMPTADVLGVQDPILWVSDGVARSLTEEGFNVEKVDAPNMAANLPLITGTVTEVSMGMYMHEKVNIASDLAVERSGQKFGTTKCAGEAGILAWTGSAAEFEGVFAQAMSSFQADCMSKLIPLLRSAGSQ